MNEIFTYTDGRWGGHEYSRWPQTYDGELPHVPCIPRPGSPYAPSSPIVWHTWQPDDWTMRDCGVVRFGQLKAGLMHELDKAAEAAIAKVLEVAGRRPVVADLARFIILCLRHCVDRLRLLPSERSVIIALAGHVQRLTLELAGLAVYGDIVRPRLDSLQDYRLDVLDVVGALTSDGSQALTLHRVGVPIWFQQHLRPDVAIWSVVTPSPLPIMFSQTPSYPRLVLAKRDLSGALNTLGEWQRAMNALVRRQLCSTGVPVLLSADDVLAPSEGRGAKRVRLQTRWPHAWDSALGAARPSFVMEGGRSSRGLAHDMRASATTRRKSLQPRAMDSTARSRSGFVMNPFRQYYESRRLVNFAPWASALRSLGPLPQPSQSVTYYFPPPWLLDDLVGYDVSAEKLARYLHQYLAIRLFCRTRLFDRSIAGRPLTVSEWRDALWGDYALHADAASDALRPESGHPPTDGSRIHVRHQLKQNLRHLFANNASLPSYDSASTPAFEDVPIALQTILDDPTVRDIVVWEAHEVNWRCELLALDALMVGSSRSSENDRWIREAHVSEVWGPSRSGLNLCPPFHSAGPLSPWGGETSVAARSPVRAFLELLARWRTAPSTFRRHVCNVMVCDGGEFERIRQDAIAFYVKTFVKAYQRLPIAPVEYPGRPAWLPVEPEEHVAGSGDLSISDAP